MSSDPRAARFTLDVDLYCVEPGELLTTAELAEVLMDTLMDLRVGTYRIEGVGLRIGGDERFSWTDDHLARFRRDS